MLDLSKLLRGLRFSGPTLADVWAWWSGVYLVQLANAPTIAQRIRGHVLPALGQLGPRQLTPSRIERHLNRLAGQGLAPATLNAIRSHLSRMLTDATDEGLWTSNPCARVRARRVPQRIWPTLTTVEARELLQDVGPYRNAWALCLYLGLRKGELLGLRVGDVDTARQVLHVQRSHDGATTKTGKARILPVVPELWPYVEAQLREARGGLLFPTAEGGHHRRDTKLAARLRSALKRVGVVDGWDACCRWCLTRSRTHDNSGGACPRCDRELWLEPVPRQLRAHDLRHTFTTLAFAAGVARDVLRVVLGHSGDVTSIYLHLGLERVRGELQKLTLAGDTNE